MVPAQKERLPETAPPRPPKNRLVTVGLAILWAFTIYQSSAIVVHEVKEATTHVVLPGQIVSVWDSSRLEMQSWSMDPTDSRWGLNGHASLTFRQDRTFQANQSCRFEFDLVEHFAEQQVDLELNATPLRGFSAKTAGRYRVSFPCRMLRADQNRIEFRFPKAASPHSVNPALPDDRPLGIGLRTFAFDVDVNEYTLGQELKFSEAPTVEKFLRSGWSVPEPWGIWSTGAQSTIFVNLPPDLSSSVILSINARSNVTANHPGLTVKVQVNGVLYDTWKLRFSDGDQLAKVRELEVSKTDINRFRPVQIVFDVDDPKSPAELGLSADDRKLGLGLLTLLLKPGSK